MPQQEEKNMKIELDYFDEVFCIKDADFSKVNPFCHADVIVNCDQPLSQTNGPLERKVANYLSKVSGIKARWYRSTEWTQPQLVDKHTPPRISKLGMRVEFYI